jgi:hypothetical protein
MEMLEVGKPYLGKALLEGLELTAKEKKIIFIVHKSTVQLLDNFLSNMNGKYPGSCPRHGHNRDHYLLRQIKVRN